LSPRAFLRCLLSLLLVALGERTAQAESRLFVSLDYEVDAALAGCPQDSAFRSMIADQLGYDPFQAGSTHRVVTRTRSSGEGIVGNIEWYDAEGARRGERELHTERADCAAFTRTLAFAVAVQIQLLAEDVEEPRAEAETPPVAQPPAKPRRSPVEDVRTIPPKASTPKDRSSWRFFGGLGVTGSFGMLPGLVPAGRLFAGARRGHFGFELGGETSLPGRYVDDGGNGFDHHVAFGTLAGCGFLGLISGCVVGKAGRLGVSGVGVDVRRSPAAATAELGARLSLNPELGRFTSALRLEALAPLVSWGVHLNGTEVFRASPVVIGLGADLGVFF
jgi:hypothetical protein